MDDEQFKVSKELLKTVTVDTRVDILKALENRPMTASELSRFLDRHVTTVAEHLGLLKNSNLVERVERPGRKWIYYKLSRQGKKILHPESYKWVMIFATIFIVFISGIFVWNTDAYPGQLLYGIKRARENLQLSLTQDNLNRARKYIDFSEERLKEAKAAAAVGQEETTIDLLNEYKNEITNAKIEIEEAKKKNMSVTSILEILSEVTPEHILILENILVKKPELKDDIKSALVISIESHESSIQELQNITGKQYTPSISKPIE